MKETQAKKRVKELRKHIAWYTKNLKNSSEFRNSINVIEDKKELTDKIQEYFKTLQNKDIVLIIHYIFLFGGSFETKKNNNIFYNNYIFYYFSNSYG